MVKSTRIAIQPAKTKDSCYFILDVVMRSCYSEGAMALSGKIINKRYRLFEKLRATGFAEYYRCFDEDTGSDAVFTFFSGAASSRRAQDVYRFKLDAKKVAGHHHPRCACPIEVGILFDICYQVTQYYEGPAIADLINERRIFSPSQLLTFARDIADALIFLHACGITHLGLDPSHIVLFKEKPYIIDVGAAHVKKYDTEELLASRLDYISPEETGMISASPDARSDLFSLGAILFRLAAGKAPFTGPRITATLHNIISLDPDFGSIEKSGLSAECFTVIKRLLAKEPDKRYESAEALRTHLDAIISGKEGYHATSYAIRRSPAPFEDDSESQNALYAYDKAQLLLKKIAELSASSGGAMSDDALREIAHIRLITGQYDETLRICREMYSKTGDPHLKAEIIALKSAAHFRRNEWQKCIDGAMEGLRLLGEKFPKGGLCVWLRSVREALLFLIGFIIPVRFAGGGKKIETYKSILSIYKTLIEAFMFRNMGPEFLFASLRMNVLARWKFGRSKELGISIIGISLVFAALGYNAIAEKLLSRALDISLSANDRWGEAYALGFLGLIYEFSGKYRQGIEHYYPASMRTFTEIGDIKNIGIIHIGLVQSLLHLSEYDKALMHNSESQQIARRMDDSFFEGMSLIYFARICREKGEFEKAKKYSDEAIQFNRDKHLDQNLCASLIERACLFVEGNEYTSAISMLEEARKLDTAGYFSPQHVNHLYAHLAEAYAKAYTATPTGSSQRDKKILHKAMKFARAATRKSRSWPSLQSKALRAHAIVASACGNYKRAIRFFEKSVTIAKNSGGRFDEALSLLEYALFSLQRGDNEKSRECLVHAFDIFSSIGSMGYRDMCGRLLGIGMNESMPLHTAIRDVRQRLLHEAGFNLAAGIHNADKLNAMMNSIYEYLGAEEAFLFCINGDTPGPLFVYPEAADDAISRMTRAAEEYLTAKFTNSIICQKSFQRIPERYRMGTKFHFLPLGSDEHAVGVCAIISSLIPSLHDDDLAILQDIMAHALILHSKYDTMDFTATRSARKPEITDSTREKLEKALVFIRENYLSDISREGLAVKVGLSPNYFSALFADYTGKKLNDYIIDLRIERASDLLTTTDDKIIDIAYTAGFENLRTFNRAFKKKRGITPQEYRKTAQKCDK